MKFKRNNTTATYYQDITNIIKSKIMKQKRLSFKKLTIEKMFNEGGFGFQTKVSEKNPKIGLEPTPRHLDVV